MSIVFSNDIAVVSKFFYAYRYLYRKILMQIESRKNKKSKNAKRLNSIRGTQRFTKPSQTNGGAKVQIIPETTKRHLAQKYLHVPDPHEF